MNDIYKPLTPAFRADIQSSIDANIAELRTCTPNPLVNMQISGQMALKNLFNNLPDGYLVPLRRSNNYDK